MAPLEPDLAFTRFIAGRLGSGPATTLPLESAVAMDLIRVLLAILLPLGVFARVGLGRRVWLNILFPPLGYIPGIGHAI